MDYKTMRDRIEDIVNDNHRDFVKAMISIEKGINDESALDKLYDAYMDNDSLNLLNEEFDYLIEDLRKQGRQKTYFMFAKRVILSILQDILMKLMEKWGSGIPRVVREVCDEGLAVPVFEGGEVDLVVNIYRKGIGPSEDRTATDATNSATNATELTEDEKLIIVAVKQNTSITQQALHNQTGITIGTIMRILPRLQEKGVLIREGNRRSGNWKVIK